MRNATGSAWIFSICLTFIILFTAYLAISLNYAKAFRIKNYVVSMVEENEGYIMTDEGRSSFNSRVVEYLTNQGYGASGRCENSIEVEGYDRDWELVDTIDDFVTPGSNQHNICIYRMPSPDTGDEDLCTRARYRVVAFFKFDIPVVGYMMTFQVAGESRYIYDFANGCVR